MTDIAGVVIGGVALTSLFDQCLACFEYVRKGKNFGKDVSKTLLDLEILRLKLSRWGRCVQMAQDSETGSRLFSVSLSSPEEGRVAEWILGDILQAFKNAEAETKKLEPTANDQHSAIQVSASAEVQTLESIVNRIREMTRRWQTHTSFKTKVEWVFYGQKQLNDLVDNLSQRIEQLTLLFPASQAEAYRKLCDEDAKELAKPTGSEDVRLIKEASTSVDPLLSQLISEVAPVSQNSYFDTTVDSVGTVLLGDDVGAGACISGRGNMYQKTEIRGSANVQVGNIYRGNASEKSLLAGLRRN